MKVGDKVQVIPPHPEAGAIGFVAQIWAANRDMERRARVTFPEPYPGRETIAARMLKVVR